MARKTEPVSPPKGRKSYTGPQGGTYVKGPHGKEYWGNNGRK